MTSANQLAEREKTATRLLAASVKNSYDPDVDIDWDAPLVDGMYFLPPERSSLYGTSLWDGFSEDQRIELTKHEVASIASVGIWFEVILMQLLVKHVYDLDPTKAHVKYSLTEIADECRHSMMFARLVERLGCPAYGPPRISHELGRLMKIIGFGPSMFAGILIAEEITDRMQRENMQDERVQPLVRMVNRIHVVEEARHVRFAREEMPRLIAATSKAGMQYHRIITGRAAFVISRSLINPEVYRSVGIDPAYGRRVALNNPHHRATLRWSAERIVAFLDEMGLIGGGIHRALWRKAYLLP